MAGDIRREIWVVDDEETTADLVRLAFAAKPEFKVRGEHDCRRILNLFEERGQACDLFLLDLKMPHVGGLELLKQLRAHPAAGRVPVIMLTGSAKPEDSEACLEAGADDFVLKPFRAPELTARIQAVLRRCHPLETRAGKIKVGPLELDLPQKKAILDGCVLHLTSTEFNFLRFLAEHSGAVMDRKVILRKVWGWSVARHQKIPTKTIQAHVDNIRAKLGTHRDLLQTVDGHGLRLGS